MYKSLEHSYNIKHLEKNKLFTDHEKRQVEKCQKFVWTSNTAVVLQVYKCDTMT